MMHAKSERAIFASVLSLTLIGTFARLSELDKQLCYDEVFTYERYVSHGMLACLTDYSLPNNHVLHSVLATISTSLLGNDPWAIRVPAFIAGVLTIPLTYLVGSCFADSRVAIVACSLVAMSPQACLYSVCARGYSIVTLLFCVQVLLHFRFFENPSAARFAAACIASASAVFTVPTAVIPVIAAGIASLRFDHPEIRKRILMTAGMAVSSAMLSLVFYAPILLNPETGSLFSNPFVKPHEFATVLSALPTILGGAALQLTSGLPNAVTALALGMAALGVATSARNASLLALAGGVTGAVVAVCLLSRTIPPARTFTFTIPVVAIFSAAGVSFISSRIGAQSWMPVSALVICLSGALWTSHAGIINDLQGPGGYCPEARDIVEQLRQSPGTRIPIGWKPAPFVSYYLRKGL